MGSIDPEVSAAIAGDQRAQSMLWRAHRGWLAAILLSHKPRQVDVEDLMQDVAVKFVSKLHTLRDPAAFRPWLRMIAVNAARESARSMTSEAARGVAVGGEGASAAAAMGVAGDRADTSEGAPQEEVMSREEAKRLLAHVRTLPLEFREPLLLRCVQGLGCRRIAEILGLPVTTIETRLSRARKMLLEEWETARRPKTAEAASAATTPSTRITGRTARVE